ncbi:MAG: TetR family transcriptional regulator [Pararhodobacter sp.]|nr:TetR family transcriptional regulator [Pararhodobacter sp.]
MYQAKTDLGTRQRRPSRRAQETRRAIFAAAEALFAERGFDGTSTRDIAAKAAVTPALVSFHGGTKQALFEAVVQARASELSAAREAALAELMAAQPRPPLRAILAAFIRPLMARATGPDPGWRAYARLIAMISADPQWRALTARCFDPTVARFSQVIAASCPRAAPEHLAAGLVFSVAAMLALITSTWRIDALADSANGIAAENDSGNQLDRTEALICYAEAGMLALLGQGAAPSQASARPLVG